jgi:hypothetical protein
MSSASSRLNRRSFLSRSATLAAASASAPALSPLLHAAGQPGAEFRSAWDGLPDRPWLGPEYWANPLQDWRVANGRIECLNAAPDRNVHVLTRQLANRPGNVRMSVRVGRVGGGKLAGKGSFGFRLGILGTLKDYPELHDYRNNLWPASGPLSGGVIAGVAADGRVFTDVVYRVPEPGENNHVRIDLNRETIELRLNVVASGAEYDVTLTVHDGQTGAQLGQSSIRPVQAGNLVGNLALVCNFPAASSDVNAKGKAKAKGKASAGGYNPGVGQFAFSDWQISGSKLSGNDEQTFGPICWSQYTLSGGVLKLTAQMAPVGSHDSDTVKLQLKDGSQWKTISEEKIHPQARTATFRIAGWNDKKDAPYRVAYTLRRQTGDTEHYWSGLIRRDPVDKTTITVGDVSCNVHTIFPNVPLVKNMAALDPDLLAFTGDQFYESTAGYGVQRAPLEPAILDYLRKWFFHGWTWRELLRDRPSVSIPDDHDVYQGNLWGEGGDGKQTTQEAGGYDLPAEWVNVVHRTQTSHHPDPYDPTPGKRGTTNYYGPLTYGRISFAILADRQYKSGPEGKVPPTGDRGDHVVNPEFDPATADVAGLQLLGDQQTQFLRDWVLDWRGADMKAVISQTIFAGMATTHGGNQEVLMADYDANGWPQSPRNEALKIIRKAFAFHLAGDQHLPAVVQYGIEEHGDGPVAFAGPAVNVGYPRWWEPPKTRRNKKSGTTTLTGNFLDHFGHPLTVLAVKNGPYQPPKPVLEQVDAKTSGLGVVRFNKARRTITIECWPYSADVREKGTQMDTWPVNVPQMANYGRRPAGHLPTLKIVGVRNPVVQIIDEKSGEVIYILRVAGGSFQPHVFASGKYTAKVGDPDLDRWITVTGLDASFGNRATLSVRV